MAATEDAVAPRTCGTARVGRDAVGPAGGQPAEGGGLHPLRIKIECRRTEYFALRQAFRQIRRQQGVADASTANVNPSALRRGAADFGGGGFGCKRGQRTQNIVRIFPAGKPVGQIRQGKQFAAGTFGLRSGKIVMAKQAFQQ